MFYIKSSLRTRMKANQNRTGLVGLPGSRANSFVYEFLSFKQLTKHRFIMEILRCLGSCEILASTKLLTKKGALDSSNL